MILLFPKFKFAYYNLRNEEFLTRRPNIATFWTEFYEEYNYEGVSLGATTSLMNLLCMESKYRNWGNRVGAMPNPGGIFVGTINKEGKD